MKLQVFRVNMHRVGVVLFAAGLIAALSLAFSIDANAEKLLGTQDPPWGGNANLTFSQYVPSPDAQSIAVGDFNRDGYADLITSNSVGNTLVLHNDGLGSFTVAQTFAFPGGNHLGVVVGDLDDDDYPDALLFAHNLNDNRVLWNNDDDSGTFSDGGSAFWSNRDVWAALGDLDGDGDLDVMVVAGLELSGQIRTWENDGEGNFSLMAEFDDAYKHVSLALGYLNDDDCLDAFTTSWENGYNKVWLNDCYGNFSEHQSIPGANTNGVALGDLDGDGDLDAYLANINLAWANFPDEVWFNDGEGNFSNSGQILNTASTFIPALGDLDGDLDLDVYISSSPTGNVADEIWVNDGSGFFSLRRTLADGYNGVGAGLVDIDKDGDLDALAVEYNEGYYFMKNGDWRQAAQMPQGTGFYGYAQCADDPDNFYMIGGLIDDTTPTHSVWRYNVNSDSWVNLAPIPDAIDAPPAVCYEGHIYVIGYYLQIYHIATDSWTVQGVIPRGVGAAAMAAWDGKIYQVGGGPGYYYDPPTNHVDVYDIATDTWTLDGGAPLPEAVLLPGYTQVGQYLYVVGGTGVESPAHNVDLVQRYDIALDTWKTVTFPSARGMGLTLSYSGDKLYAMGGEADGGDYFDAVDLVEVYDLSTWPTGTWEEFTDTYPYPVIGNTSSFCSEVKTGGEVWSIGGVSGTLGDSDWLTANSYHATGEACLRYGVQMPVEMEDDATIGKTVEYTFSITNTGTVTDFYNLSLSSTWDADLSVESPVQIGPGEVVQVTLSVTVPADALGGEQDITVVTASSLRDPAIMDTTSFTTTVLHRMIMPLAMRH